MEPTRRGALRRWHLVVLAVIVFLVALPGAWAWSSNGSEVTGDEPQYLMTAISLGDDGDLDLVDQRRQRVWEEFHQAGPPLHQEEAQPDGSRVSPHDPLLPAVLAGPVRLGGWRAARVVLAMLAGVLAALTAWVAHRRFGVSARWSLVAAGIFGASAPLATFGTQVYPELPAALAAMTAVAAAPSPGALRRGARGMFRPPAAEPWRVGLFVLAIVALPWLSVKYAPVAASIAGLGLWAWWRTNRRVAWSVGFVLALAGVAYLALHHLWYGGWTVYAAGSHFTGGELSVAGNPNLAGRSARLLGLLTDRHFGLVVWQPAWLLAIPALGALGRRRPQGWLLIALPLAAGWLNATFVALTMHGWWWPGRQVVVVLPLVVVAVAVLADRATWARRTLVAAGALGILIWVWLLGESVLGNLALVVDFEHTDNPLVHALRPLLPDYRADSMTRWIWHAAWVGVAGALATIGWRSLGRPFSSSDRDRPGLRSHREPHEAVVG